MLKAQHKHALSCRHCQGQSHAMYHLGVSLQVWRHHVGGNADQDELVYHETDEQMYVHLGKSRDEKILSIHVGKTVHPCLRPACMHCA